MQNEIEFNVTPEIAKFVHETCVNAAMKFLEFIDENNYNNEHLIGMQILFITQLASRLALYIESMSTLQAESFIEHLTFLINERLTEEKEIFKKLKPEKHQQH